jgi:hypothetical protein
VEHALHWVSLLQNCPELQPASVLQTPVEHEWQELQGVWQQVPATQLPFWHWPSPVQAPPSATFGLQVPDAQKLLATQSASPVQLGLQADADAQSRSPGHAASTLVHLWVLSQVFLDKVEPRHESEPHEELAAT